MIPLNGNVLEYAEKYAVKQANFNRKEHQTMVVTMLLLLSLFITKNALLNLLN